jgi:hypothetical protein
MASLSCPPAAPLSGLMIRSTVCDIITSDAEEDRGDEGGPCPGRGYFQDY